MIAEIIAFVGRAPQLTGDGVDSLSDAVADAGSVDFDERTFGRVFQHIGPVELSGMRIWIIGIRCRAYRNQHIFVVLSENNVSGPVPSTLELGVSGNIRNDGFWGSSRMQIAGVVRNPLNGGRIADVDILRIYCRIEGDS